MEAAQPFGAAAEVACCGGGRRAPAGDCGIFHHQVRDERAATPRRHRLARGRAYPTTARAGQVNFGAERTGIVSDVRVTLRGAILDANKKVRDLSELQPALNRLQWKLSQSLSNLTMPAPMAPGAPPEGGLVDGAFTPAAPPLEGAAPPPALDEGRTDA